MVANVSRFSLPPPLVVIVSVSVCQFKILWNCGNTREGMEELLVVFFDN